MIEPIDMIAIFDKQGKITPYKFKHKDNSVKVAQITRRYEDKRAGNPMLCFRCFHPERGFHYHLLYEELTHKWYIKFE